MNSFQFKYEQLCVQGTQFNLGGVIFTTLGNDVEDWDDETLIPCIDCFYVDTQGIVHMESYSPRQLQSAIVLSNH